MNKEVAVGAGETVLSSSYHLPHLLLQQKQETEYNPISENLDNLFLKSFDPCLMNDITDYMRFLQCHILFLKIVLLLSGV